MASLLCLTSALCFEHAMKCGGTYAKEILSREYGTVFGVHLWWDLLFMCAVVDALPILKHPDNNRLIPPYGGTDLHTTTKRYLMQFGNEDYLIWDNDWDV